MKVSRVAGLDWSRVEAALDDDGCAAIPPILSRDSCQRVAAYYEDPHCRFRSTVSMARHGFGSGEYRYFDYPLPAEVQRLRERFYAGLAPIANRWESRLGNEPLWPADIGTLIERCHREGQGRPTPLLLRYGAGDYNCLHQDLYGPIHFPLQVIIVLSAPRRDFEGGELILVEQRPRMQSRPIVMHLEQGGAAIIPVRERPRRGKRGFHRAPMRHGVGRVLSGRRHTLGLIFHDAA